MGWTLNVAGHALLSGHSYPFLSLWPWRFFSPALAVPTPFDFICTEEGWCERGRIGGRKEVPTGLALFQGVFFWRIGERGANLHLKCDDRKSKHQKSEKFSRRLHNSHQTEGGTSISCFVSCETDGTKEFPWISETPTNYGENRWHFHRARTLSRQKDKTERNWDNDAFCVVLKRRRDVVRQLAFVSTNGNRNPLSAKGQIKSECECDDGITWSRAMHARILKSTDLYSRKQRRAAEKKRELHLTLLTFCDVVCGNAQQLQIGTESGGEVEEEWRGARVRGKWDKCQWSGDWKPINKEIGQ